jgi:hypothetical protein
MSSRLLLFPARNPRFAGWTNEELAELYRVEHALIQAGIQVETDRGVTDEGEPWFVFCRATGDVLVHVARLDGRYHLYSPALAHPMSGVSFSSLTRSFIEGVPTPPEPSARVIVHPAALLSVLVLTIFYSADLVLSQGAQAAEGDAGGLTGAEGTAPALDASPLAGLLDAQIHSPDRSGLKAVFGNQISTLNSGRHEAAGGAQSAYMMLVTSVIGFATVMHERPTSSLFAENVSQPKLPAVDLPELLSSPVRYIERSAGAGETALRAEVTSTSAPQPMGLPISTSPAVREVVSSELTASISTPVYAAFPQILPEATATSFVFIEPTLEDNRAWSNPAQNQNQIESVKEPSTSVAESSDLATSDLPTIASAAIEVNDANSAPQAETATQIETSGASVVETAASEQGSPPPSNSVANPGAEGGTPVDAGPAPTTELASIDAVITAALDLTEHGGVSYSDIVKFLEAGPTDIVVSEIVEAELALRDELDGVAIQDLDGAAKIRIEQFLQEATEPEIAVIDGSILIYDASVPVTADYTALSWDIVEAGTISIIGHLHPPVW